MAYDCVTPPKSAAHSRRCITGVVIKRVFGWMMQGLVAEVPDKKTISIGATHLNANQTAYSLTVRKGEWTAGRLNQRWHEHKTTCGNEYNCATYCVFVTIDQIVGLCLERELLSMA